MPLIMPKDKYMSLFGYTGGNNKYCYTFGIINRWWTGFRASRTVDREGETFYSIDFGIGYLEFQMFKR
jgi:hypothetical protein